MRGERLHGARSDFIGGPTNLVVVLLGLLVDSRDTRAGGEIVELVEEDVLPRVVELSSGIGAAIEPREGSELLGVKHLLFTVAHVALVSGLCGEYSAVVFEIELVIPGGNANRASGGCGKCSVAGRECAVVPGWRVRRNFLLNALQIGERSAKLLFRADFVGFHPVQTLVEHRARGTATMVTDAEEIHHVAHARSLLCGGGKITGEANRINILICVVVREVSEDFAAVRRLPPEELERKLVGVVPGHLLRDEVVDAGPFVNLRKLPVVAEGVGVPADHCGVTVDLLERGLADEELTDERFAVGHVQVGLNPHSAD